VSSFHEVQARLHSTSFEHDLSSEVYLRLQGSTTSSTSTEKSSTRLVVHTTETIYTGSR
jgi:hypothetical protein